MTGARARWTLALPLLVALFTGCVKSMLVNGQIAATREGAGAFDTFDDVEVAEQAAAAGLAQFEGMRLLAPDNPDALFLLAKGWTGYAFAFAEDAMEVAQDAQDRDLAEAHKERATRAYERGIAAGLALMETSAPGFETVKDNEAALQKWLKESFRSKEDAEGLFWTGYAWLGRANLLKDNAEVIASLYIGVALLERSVELDPNYNSSTGQTVLAAYHARTAMAELDQSKEMFDAVLEKTGRRSLLVQLQYAIRYACAKADGAMYDQLLNEVLAAEVSEPNIRLMNTIAKRRAARWKGEQRKLDACGIEAATSTPEG